jgi:transposase
MHGGVSNGGTAAPTDPMTKMTKQFEWYSQKCKSIVQMNRKYQNDIFWPYLKKLILKNNLSTYSHNILQQLQNAVWKRLRQVSMTTPAS